MQNAATLNSQGVLCSVTWVINDIFLQNKILLSEGTINITMQIFMLIIIRIDLFSVTVQAYTNEQQRNVCNCIQ